MTLAPQRPLDGGPLDTRQPGTGPRGRPRPRAKGGAVASGEAPPSHVELEGSNAGTVHDAPDTARARRVDRRVA